MSRFSALPVLVALLVAATAVAAPSEQAGTLTGATLASSIAVSSDDRYIAVSEKDDGGLVVWDAWSLSSGPASASTCVPAAAVEFADNLVTSERFYVACEDGLVYFVELDTATIPPGLAVSSPIELNGGVGDVIDLAWARDDDYIHALVVDSGYMSLHRISLADNSVTALSPSTTVGGTPVDLAIGDTGTPLLVARSDGSLSRFDRSGDSYSSAADTVVSFGGVLSSVSVSTDYGTIFVSDSGQSTLWSLPVDGSGQSVAVVTDLAGAEVVELAEEGGELLVYAAGSGTTVEVFDALGALRQSIELADSSAVSIAVAGAAAASAYVAAIDGSVRVLSDLPLIESLQSSAAIVGGDEPFTVSFSASKDGSWDVRIGGDGVPGSGTSLANGVLLADETTSLSLSADDLIVEGANRLFVFVTGEAGTAVDSTSVTLDEPPGPVSEFVVSPGDSRLVLEWTSGGETDLDHFVVYLSDQPFSAEDPSLPSFSLDTADGPVSYPLSVAAGLAGAGHSFEASGLDNGSAYYVAVEAVDVGGLVGPTSEVLSGTPEATCGAAECAGDESGCSCSGGSSLAGPVRPTWWLAGLAFVALVLRRRQLR